RGPTRDGLVSASNAPAPWPESFRRAWRIEVGEGYSSPVISKGRVFLHARHDPDEVVMAVEVVCGKVLWAQKYPAPLQKNQYAPRMAEGPYATPLVLGERLFTLGATAIFTARECVTGRQLWSKDFSKTVATSKMFCGTAASPLGFGGMVIAQVGSDI